MSRSNPSTTSSHPCRRWLTWAGDKGILRYYDKNEGVNVDVDLPFRFLLLDQLGGVRGWHDASESGIFSNEVRSTKTDPITVKSFKGGELACGLYQDIRTKVGDLGGHFVASLYIAYAGDDGDLTIGNIQLKASQLKSWSEFSKNHRKDMLSKAIVISGFEEGKKGKVVYRVPKFTIEEPTAAESQQALGLDEILQEYLDGYLSKPKARDAAAKHDDDADPVVTDAEADAIAAQQAKKDEFEDEIPF